MGIIIGSSPIVAEMSDHFGAEIERLWSAHDRVRGRSSPVSCVTCNRSGVIRQLRGFLCCFWCHRGLPVVGSSLAWAEWVMDAARDLSHAYRPSLVGRNAKQDGYGCRAR